MTRGPENTSNKNLGELFAAMVGGTANAGATAEGAFDVDRLGRKLMAADDPVAFLRGFVSRVRASKFSCALEARLADRLDESGLLGDDGITPAFRVVRPKTNGLFYLRIDDPELPYLAKLRVLGAEAALNACLMCSALLDEPLSAGMEEVVRTEQRIARSVAQQATSAVVDLDEEKACGEWRDRRAIAAGIECLRLPYRLQARFRVNSAAGEAAIEVDLVPPRIMPRAVLVDGIGIVAASEAMRRAAATDYNLRVLAMIAAYVFANTCDLRRIWVAGVVDTATSHACYCSAVLEREDLEGLDLAHLEPVALMRFLCAAIDESGATLSPVAQGFSLDEERFCPRGRHERVELTDRRLSPPAGAALGCRDLSGISVDDGALAAEVGRKAASLLTDSTQTNVRAIMALADETADPRIAAAARKVVSGLIAGDLDESDPEAVCEAFENADDLAAVTRKAQESLLKGDAAACASAVAEALAPIEAQGRFRDSAEVCWRVFDGYADRVLYNRLFSPEGHEVRLAPRPYFDALQLLSASDLLLGRPEAACELARQAARLAPLSTQASLNFSHCLLELGRVEESVDECSRMLECASDPQSIGFGYITMAQLQWKLGNMVASQACYQMAMRVLPAGIVEAARQISSLLGATPQESLSDEHALQALADRGIPFAPTDEVVDVLREGAAAAIDENLFIPGKELLFLVVALTRDDIDHGILRSLEDEPDF